MWISKYFVYFVVFSFFGWIYETIYDTIRKKEWDNRGFLFGPICPIYGIGADLIIIIATLFTGAASRHFAWWEIFLIAFFGSIVLEYVTSYVLEKQFHAVWWDYSKMPFNIHGRVCLPASIGFGVAGIFVVNVIGPAAAKASDLIPPIWMEAFSLIFMSLITIDITLTVNALTDFNRKLAAFDESVNSHMEAFVNGVTEKSANFSEKIAEERERFTLESAKNVLTNTGGLYRSALKRVSKFNSPKIEMRKLEMITDVIKNRREKRQQNRLEASEEN